MAKGARNEFERKKCRTGRDNSSSSKPSCKARNKSPKGHTKNRLFVFFTIPKDIIFHILSSRVESSEKVGFNSDGSTVISDSSVNVNIFSE